MIEIEEQADSITLKITSNVELVSPLAEALHKFCLAIMGNESHALQVQYAVVEAVNNIILHAYKKEDQHNITVQCYKDKNVLLVEIIDHGLSMSCLPVPSLPSFDAENGRGWWIIDSCVDDYYYKVIECIERQRLYRPNESNCYENSSVKSHSNILTFTKNF